MTIFKRILDGEIPCHRLYEDEHVLAFLDVNPISYGHTLVIPKEEAATIDQLSDDAAAALGRALPRISRAVLKASGAKAFNLLQNNGPSAHQAVFHVHVHVIPKHEDGSGLGVGWQPSPLSDEHAATLKAAIAAELA